MNRTMKMPKIPFDKLWKSVTEEFFEDFLAFFLAELHQQVDYNVPFEFLEKELKSVITGKNNKEVDKLVRVMLKNGEERWVFIHIEFENSHKPIIKQRMYDYHSRIKEKFGQEITAIVIFNGRSVPKNRNRYEKSVFGTKIIYEYNTYAIIEQDEAELEVNPNPFAIAVLANLYVLKTYGDDQKRLELKKQIYHLARERGYSDDKIRRLLVFINELVKLPIELESDFDKYIAKPQKSTNTMYTTQRTRDHIDALAKAEFGNSVSEINAALAKTIVFLFTEIKISVEDIAQKIGIEVSIVYDVLVKQKLVKKKK